MNNKILVAVDGSPVSLNALRYAKELAQAYNLKMSIVSVIDEVASEEDCKSLNVALHKIEAAVADMGDRCVFVCKAGKPVDVIVEDAITAKCDSIIIGDRGWNTIKKAILGSVSEGVLEKSPIPVTIVRAQE